MTTTSIVKEGLTGQGPDKADECLVNGSSKSLKILKRKGKQNISLVNFFTSSFSNQAKSLIFYNQLSIQVEDVDDSLLLRTSRYS